MANDVALASSELATNVIQYAGTDWFEIALERAGATRVLEVSHATAGELDRCAPGVPSACGGRGLMIVEAVMDHVELVETAAGTPVRCTRTVV